jgi:hypothetical protein
VLPREYLQELVLRPRTESIHANQTQIRNVHIPLAQASTQEQAAAHLPSVSMLEMGGRSSYI